MKRFELPNINSETYWDSHQTAMDFGLRQKKYLELAGSGESIVELGCGLSPMLNHADKFEERWGVDYSPETIKTAIAKYRGVNYVQGDVINTGLNSQFDAVVAGEVIEHLEDPELLFKEMDRLCKPNGIMILSTPILEFTEPEHIWQFYESDFTERGFNVETIHSERFIGRSYIFAWKKKS